MEHLTITIARSVVTGCDQGHGKVTKTESTITFSYLKREPHRSCALCVDKITGITDDEIQTLIAQEKEINPRLSFASLIRDTALQTA